jgi:peptidase E
LFRRDQGTGGVEDDLATHLLGQDLIYVCGGNVVCMLGAWRAHGLDAILRKAWRRGVVLCGPSAGSLCWFEQALSAFHGAPRPVRGLGLLPYSNCVHYDAEPARRAEYHRFVADGMRAGFAVEDGVALHFRCTGLERVVSSRPDGNAFLIEPHDTSVRETRLQAQYLGDVDAATPFAPHAPEPREVVAA